MKKIKNILLITTPAILSAPFTVACTQNNIVEPEVWNIGFASDVSNIVYSRGDAFDVKYNKVSNIPSIDVSFADGLHKTIFYGEKNLSFEGYNANQTGEQKITVKYVHNGKTFCIWYKITVLETAYPVIVSQPEDVSVNYPDRASFTVKADERSAGKVTYQWQYSLIHQEHWRDLDSESAHDSTLIIPTTKSIQKNNKFRCLITSSYGRTTISDTAHLNILNAKQFKPVLYVGDNAVSEGEPLYLSNTKAGCKGTISLQQVVEGENEAINIVFDNTVCIADFIEFNTPCRSIDEGTSCPDVHFIFKGKNEIISTSHTEPTFRCSLEEDTKYEHDDYYPTVHFDEDREGGSVVVRSNSSEAMSTTLPVKINNLKMDFFMTSSKSEGDFAYFFNSSKLDIVGKGDIDSADNHCEINVYDAESGFGVQSAPYRKSSISIENAKLAGNLIAYRNTYSEQKIHSFIFSPTNLTIKGSKIDVDFRVDCENRLTGGVVKYLRGISSNSNCDIGSSNINIKLHCVNDDLIPSRYGIVEEASAIQPLALRMEDSTITTNVDSKRFVNGAGLVYGQFIDISNSDITSITKTAIRSFGIKCIEHTNFQVKQTISNCNINLTVGASEDCEESLFSSIGMWLFNIKRDESNSVESDELSLSLTDLESINIKMLNAKRYAGTDYCMPIRVVVDQDYGDYHVTPVSPTLGYIPSIDISDLNVSTVDGSPELRLNCKTYYDPDFDYKYNYETFFKFTGDEETWADTGYPPSLNITGKNS